MTATSDDTRCPADLHAVWAKAISSRPPVASTHMRSSRPEFHGHSRHKTAPR